MGASLYTFAKLKELVYTRLENNTEMFEDAEVGNIINECLKSTNIVCGFYQGSSDPIISEAGRLVYSTPAGMLYPQSVTFESSQLDPVPITRIGDDYRTWTTDTSAKLGAVARWIPIGINYFAIHPTDSVGGNAITVTGVLETPTLVLPDDAMTLEDQFVSLIVDAAYSRLPLKVSGPSALAAMAVYQKGVLPALKRLTTLRSMIFPKFFVQDGAPAMEGRQR